MFQVKHILTAICIAASPCLLFAQSKSRVTVEADKTKQKVYINIDGKPFTEFIFTDTMEKPFLYPIYAPGGQTITRGFPWNPQPGDPVDHPHHIGLWLNYENVNGLDFWNNSFAIAPAKKKQYGWIRTTHIEKTTNGSEGTLIYLADWTDQEKNVLMKERTTYVFREENGMWIIDRKTELTAAQDITMPDVKDGMLGLRVAHELELPVTQTKEYKDDKGNITKVPAIKDPSVTGNYLTSAGKTGDSAWGTRGNWCLLKGRKGGDAIGIAMIDHPKNPGYPTYWHARNYGLFALNPLGQKVFSEGKETLNFKLAKGEKTTFKYMVAIESGSNKFTAGYLDHMAGDFGRTK
jgi:hypothetical protein